MRSKDVLFEDEGVTEPSTLLPLAPPWCRTLNQRANINKVDEENRARHATFANVATRQRAAIDRSFSHPLTLLGGPYIVSGETDAHRRSGRIDSGSHSVHHLKLTVQ